MKFEGSIKHNRDTVRLLFHTAYYAYNLKVVAIRMIIGVAMSIYAFSVDIPATIQTLLILSACLIIISKDYTHDSKAQKVIDSRKDKFPTIKTQFYSNNIKIIGDNDGILEYSKIDKLIIKHDYYFLFFGDDVVSMIDSKTIKPYDTENFEKFIFEKTSKKFTPLRGVLSISLKDIIKV